MALTRRLLSSMGIEADKIDQIIEAHTETVSGLKTQIAGLNDDLAKAKETGTADSEELKALQKKYDDLKDHVEADKKAREGKDYDALKKEYDDYKADVQEKAVRRAKEKALKDLLADMKVSDKGVRMILKWQGVDGIEVDDDGKLKDATALRKSIREDWSDYIPTVDTKGAETPTPPAGKGTGAKTREEIMAIKDTTARQQAIAENLELFGAQ